MMVGKQFIIKILELLQQALAINSNKKQNTFLLEQKGVF